MDGRGITDLYKKPTDRNALRRFLGSINWIKKYIRQYSDKTHLFYDLLKKNKPFEWTKLHDKAFEDIKKSLINPPVLKLATGIGKYVLYADASRVGVGGVLLEELDGNTHVVGYASRALNTAEKKYSVTEIELLALNYCIKQFHHLLYNPKTFDVYTDHHSLVHILEGKTPPASRKISNMISQIMEYNFNLFHVKGLSNSFSDISWFSSRESKM